MALENCMGSTWARHPTTQAQPHKVTLKTSVGQVECGTRGLEGDRQKAEKSGTAVLPPTNGTGHKVNPGGLHLDIKPVTVGHQQPCGEMQSHHICGMAMDDHSETGW